MSRRPSGRQAAFAALVGLLILSFFSQALAAQVTTAAISGSIRDSSGAVLPGVAITVKNLETGIARALATDELGRYHAPGLPLGRYEVQASLAGFKTEIRSGITVTVGQDVTVDLMMEVGAVTEKVIVTGEAPLVEASSSAISGLVDQRKIRDLPLNLRSFEKLALLQPGVVAFSNERIGLIGGRRQKISVMGTRPEHSTFLLDGTDINDVYNKTPGAVTGSLTGVETVKEFRVMINSYSAEYGRAAGGTVNAVTRSGTNQFSGTLFEFLRNDKLDARNFFDSEIPPFKRNQFGGALGGPVIHNRTFFFSSYEALRERFSPTFLAFVPTQEAREGRIAGLPVSRLIRPYLDLFPLPNFPTSDPRVGQVLSNPLQPMREDFFMIRLDHRLSDSDSLFVRYSFDDAAVERPELIPITLENETTRNQYLTAQVQRVFSPKVLNNFRAAFNRNNSGAVNRSRQDLSVLRFVPQRPSFGRLEFTSDLTGIGAIERNPRRDVQNLFQYSDDLTVARGSHALKLGADARRYQINFNTITRDGGLYIFDNIGQFFAARPSRFRGAALGSRSDSYARHNLFGFYFQDDVRLRPRFTLNAGLRYEFITVPTEKYGRISNLRFPSDPDVTVGRLFENPSLRNFGPRFGFAWDVFGNGKTAVRGGFGIFHEQVMSPHWYLPFQQSVPFFTTGDIRNPRNFPNDFASLQADPRPRIQQINSDISNPYVLQYNFTIQREIVSNTALSVGYGGSRGVKLMTRRNAIAALPAGRLPDGRPRFASGTPVLRNPRFAEVVSRTSDSNSFYHSLQVSLNRRFSGGVQLQAAYTFSRSIDDQSGIGTSDASNALSTLQDPDNRLADRGLSAFDVRHNLALNYTWEFPFGPSRRWGPNLRGALGKLAGGWQLNGITMVASGNPFTLVNGFDSANNGDGGREGPHRPSLRPGASNNPIRPGNPGRYVDTSGFVLETLTFGNLGRNTLIGPGLINFDVSLLKQTYVTETKRLQFRVEFFNLMNHPNFRAPSVTGAGGAVLFSGVERVDAATGAPVGQLDPRAGKLTSTVTTSRQIQLGLKFIF